MTTAEIKELITAAALQVKVDPAVGLRMCQWESGFDPSKVNPETDAAGLFQFSPEDAERLEFDPMDPTQSIRAWEGTMRWQMSMYGGNLEKVLAAWRWGDGPLGDLLHRVGYDNPEWTHYLPPETHKYVDFIISGAPVASADDPNATQ